MTKLMCKECGSRMYTDGSSSSTLVAYMSPPGHEHDDNCVNMYYRCQNGHGLSVSKQQKCTAPGCDWVGKSECFCHPQGKVDEWPD